MLNLFGEETKLRYRRSPRRYRRARKVFASELQPELPLRWVSKPRLRDFDLCGLARAGDSEAESIMIERYVELAAFKGRDNRIPGLEEGDLVAVALEAILKAVRSYKDERIPFDRYARFLIGQAMVSAARKQKRVPLEFASYEPEELIDLDEVLECDQAMTPFRGLMLRSDISRLAELLDEPEKQVLFLKMQEFTDLEIAGQMKCSRITVWRRMKSIRKKAQNLTLCNN